MLLQARPAPGIHRTITIFRAGKICSGLLVLRAELLFRLLARVVLIEIADENMDFVLFVQQRITELREGLLALQGIASSVEHVGQHTTYVGKPASSNLLSAALGASSAFSASTLALATSRPSNLPSKLMSSWASDEEIERD